MACAAIVTLGYAVVIADDNNRIDESTGRGQWCVCIEGGGYLINKERVNFI